jgi:hypothetical protein
MNSLVLLSPSLQDGMLDFQKEHKVDCLVPRGLFIALVSKFELTF